MADNNLLDSLDLGEDETIKLDGSELSELLMNSDSSDEEIVQIERQEDGTNLEPAVSASNEAESEEIEADLLKNAGKAETKKDEEDGEFKAMEIDVLNSFNTLFKSLENKGVMTETPEDWKVESEQDISDRLVYEGKVIASNFLETLFSKYGEENRKFVEDIVIKGLDPFSYLNQAKEVKSIETLDLEDEMNLKNIYLEYETKVLGTSEDKARKKLQRIIDSGDLEEEGKDAYEELKKVKLENLSKLEVQKKEQEEKAKMIVAQNRKDLQDFLEKSAKERNLNGLQFNQKDMQEIYDYGTTEKYSIGEQNITEFDKDLLEIRRPENIDKRVMLMMLLKNNFDLKKVKLKEGDKQADNLFKTLKFKNTEGTASVKKHNTSLLDLL